MTTPDTSIRLALDPADLRALLQDLVDARVPSLHSPAGSIRAFTTLRDAAAAPAPDFFTPDTTYTEDQPFRSPEDRTDFICHGTGVNPEDGTRMAYGYGRPGAGTPWRMAAFNQEAWEQGWIPVPADPATGIPLTADPAADGTAAAAAPAVDGLQITGANLSY